MNKLLHIHILLLFTSLLYFPCNFFSEITKPQSHAPKLSSTIDVSDKAASNSFSCFFQNDTLLLQAPDCQSPASFCLEVSQNDISGYEVLLNGSAYPNANFTTCNGDQTAIEIFPGSNQVVMTELSGTCSDTIILEVFCTTPEFVDISILAHQNDTLCLDGGELPGFISSIINLCLDGSFVNYEIFEDSCIVFSGNLVGNETACFIACDADGFCDSTFVNISVLHPLPNGLKDTTIVSQISEYCFDDSLVNIVGSIETFENICQDFAGTNVNFNIDPIGNCIVYEGISVGVDTACIKICDNLGNCDTLSYVVTVVPSSSEYDTVFISVDTNNICIDDDLLPGDIISIVNTCQQNSSEHVVFEISGLCISYYGIDFGQDAACLKVTDEFGNVALISLFVTVVNTTPEVFCDSVFIGEKKEYCLDTFEIPGIYKILKVLYEDNISESVEFEENSDRACVSYEGLSLGRDSFAVAICDHFGFCDTTSFCIIVVPYFELPELTDDSVFTFKETPLVIDPLANDTVFGGLRDYYILDPPISGSAILNLDGSITYTPDLAFCARWDIFTYVACNPNGCDTASINVYIECVELTIFNAVSPNNDDVNDYFYIAKIENFPNNRLWVYNRWGNQVFDSGAEGYQNNWPGTWGDEIDLPDGTYYYILEWKESDVTTVQRGYFEMYR